MERIEEKRSCSHVGNRDNDGSRRGSTAFWWVVDNSLEALLILLIGMAIGMLPVMILLYRP